MGYLKVFTESRELQRWKTRRLVQYGTKREDHGMTKLLGCTRLGGEVIWVECVPSVPSTKGKQKVLQIQNKSEIIILKGYVLGVCIKVFYFYKTQEVLVIINLKPGFSAAINASNIKKLRDSGAGRMHYHRSQRTLNCGVPTLLSKSSKSANPPPPPLPKPPVGWQT